MQDAEREYDYNPRWTVIVLSGGFFAGCAVILAFKAANNQRGLTWGGIIELGPAGATAFYWVITACCCGFVVLAMFLAAQRLLLRKTLRLGTTGVTIPPTCGHRRKRRSPTKTSKACRRTPSTARSCYTSLIEAAGPPSPLRCSCRSELTATFPKRWPRASSKPDGHRLTEAEDFPHGRGKGSPNLPIKAI